MIHVCISEIEDNRETKQLLTHSGKYGNSGNNGFIQSHKAPVIYRDTSVPFRSPGSFAREMRNGIRRPQ
jgi:hypothetical protein